MINFWHPDDRAEELAVRRAERDASIQAMKDNVCLLRLSALSCQMVTEHANSSANSHLFPPGL